MLLTTPGAFPVAAFPDNCWPEIVETAFPICITLSGNVEYGITISGNVEYGITISHGEC